jgi:hypothetical protein
MEGTQRVDMQTDALGSPKEEEKPPLPQIGTKFYIEGIEYKVTYVNEGKRRFSSTPTQ